MKERYISPELSVIKFDEEDVIVTSPVVPSPGGEYDEIKPLA